MIGFETIGNATVTVFDKQPVLTTDPWLFGNPYFGSWGHKYKIPKEQMDNIKNSKFIFLSHGHPDHIDPDSFDIFKDKTLIIADHYGDRIYNDLKEKFSCIKLKSNTWFEISKNVRIKVFADWNQDSSLIIEILKKNILFNLNDGEALGWSKIIKDLIKNYENKFLLKLVNWGDADMINFYDKEDNFIEPLAAKKHPVGDYLSLIAKLVSANYVIPFSSFHEYQREDSVWANKYVTPMAEYKNGIHNDITYIEPFAFINSEMDDDIKSLPLKKKNLMVKKASEFKDNWSDALEAEDKIIIKEYFSKFEELQNKVGFINFIVGKKDFNLKMNGPMDKGITFELPRNSLVEACKYSIFDDLLIGNFMKTQLHNLSSLYDPVINFNKIVPKYGDNGLAYSKEELIRYERKYAKRMGIEYFYELFANQSKNYFKFFFKNYKDSKYYTKFRKYYYYYFR